MSRACNTRSCWPPREGKRHPLRSISSLVACSIHRVASTQPQCPRSFRGTKGFRSKGIERLEKDATRCDEKYRLTRIGLSMGLELRTKMCEWFLEGYRSICILQSVLSFRYLSSDRVINSFERGLMMTRFQKIQGGYRGIRLLWICFVGFFDLVLHEFWTIPYFWKSIMVGDS